MNKQNKEVFYYSESKNEYMNIYEMEPHHARNAFAKWVETDSNSGYVNGWNDAMQYISNTIKLKELEQ